MSKLDDLGLLPAGSAPAPQSAQPRATRRRVRALVPVLALVASALAVAAGASPAAAAVITRTYVTNLLSDTVSVIDTATNTVVATIPVGDTPLGVAVNPDGTRVYVTSNSLMEQLLLMDQRNEQPIAMDPSIDLEPSTGKLVVKLCMAGEDHLSATLAAAAIVGRLMKEGGNSPQSPADDVD